MGTKELLLANDASLKEYYVKIQDLYTNAVNILSALNQSLYTSAAEIEVNIASEDGSQITTRIPSFLHLESKLEELSTNIDAIFNIPKDGEAWFTENETSYKLNLVRSNTAPIYPTIKTSSDLIGSLTDNNFLKDLVFPKTFIKFALSNIPKNAHKMFMRKLVINSQKTFLELENAAKIDGKYKTISYNDCKALLYNLRENIDYSEYDSVLDLPIKKDYYNSNFKITKIVNERWIDTNTQKINYNIQLDTILYENAEDSTITYSLKIGDKICLNNEMIVYTIKAILPNNVIQIEEYIGYTTLQTFADNSQMVLKLYIDDYSKFDYVNVPLEENQYIIVFLGTIYDNVRSTLSDGILLDLSNIKMIDKFGSPIKDINGSQYNYLSYYNEFCTNLGDLLLGMSKCLYSQITNYTSAELDNLLNSLVIKQAVTNSINGEVLKVVAINKHLTDDATTDDIIKLHNQKNEINALLQTCQSNIDQIYSTLLTTDFSQNVTVTQKSLQDKINGFYSERVELQKQLISVIDNINSKSSSIVSRGKTKYRIRGISDVSILENAILPYKNAELIGIDIEYKYKTTSKDTATLTTINGSTFTDWNKQPSIDKERILVFSNDSYAIKYKEYTSNINTIKWNQIDIPINYGEDVSIRIRYKYSIGQPFMTLYTPWSDEYTVTFPLEFTENIELSSVLETNANDTVTASFNKTLINEGYTEHIQNKVLSNEQVFFHMPENIYSGFNTPENNLISLKDKLNEITTEIEQYKQYVSNLTNTNFEIYLNYDDNTVLLSANSINKINIYNTDHITDSFIRKDMNIVVKNTGTSRLNFYSIFPGNIDEYLITSSNEFISYNKGNYERVPIYNSGVLDGQRFGQWIYFRQNNPYSKEDIYFNEIRQNAYDYSAAIAGNKPTFNSIFTEYISKDNSQALLAFRNNAYISGFNYNLINETNVEEILNKYFTETPSITTKLLSSFDWFIYPEYNNLTNILQNANENYYNKYIFRYEDIIAKINNKNVNINAKTSFSSLKNKVLKNTGTFVDTTKDFVGGFLYPNLTTISQILVTDTVNGVLTVNPGESINVPIVFEYYVDDSLPNITKSLYFDIKHSLITEPRHYMIQITGNYDYSNSGDIYKNIDEIIR